MHQLADRGIMTGCRLDEVARRRSTNVAMPPSQAGVASLPLDQPAVAAGACLRFRYFASASKPAVANADMISSMRSPAIPRVVMDTSSEANTAWPSPDGSDRISMRVPLPW